MVIVSEGAEAQPTAAAEDLPPRERHRYIWLAPLVRGRRVLELDCGTGRGAALLAQWAASVHGIDPEDQAIARARADHDPDRLSFATGTAGQVPLPEAAVDVVVALGPTATRAGQLPGMLAEARRVLRDGGTLVVALSGEPAPPGRGPESTQTLVAQLAARFAHVRLYGQTVGASSLIAAESGAAPVVEARPDGPAATPGLAAPDWRVAVASDDPAAAAAAPHSRLAQDITTSDAVLDALETARAEALEAPLAALNWVSGEVAALQRSSGVSTAPLGKLLRRLIQTRALYALSRLRFLSEKRRRKFFRSAEKRDPMLLASRLDRFCTGYFRQLAQAPALAEALLRQSTALGLRVTAIVPNYNHARFLPQRLDSILGQTYPLIDVIVLDDGSTDDSRRVIEDYVARHPGRLRAVWNTTNSGSVFSQWQKGHDLATGDLVWICESDDFCEPTFVERLVGSFRDPSVMLAFGRVELADREGTEMPGLGHYREEAEPGIWSERLVRPAARWFAGGFGVKNVIPNVGGSLWRRMPLDATVWAEARSYRVMGDWYLYSVLAQGGQIAFDPAAVAYFRQHGKNTSGAAAQAMPWYYDEYARLMTALKRRWNLPAATVDRFLASCRRIHDGAHVQGAAFETLLPAARLKAVTPEVPHVLMGILGFSVGGGEILAIHLANALRRKGVMVSVLQLMDADDRPEIRALLDPSIPVYRANTLRDRGAGAFLAEAGVSVIHSHIAAVERLLLDEAEVETPYVVTLHGSYEATEIGRRRLSAWARRIDRFVHLADRNLAPFEGVDLDPAKVLKLPNAMPVDDEPFPLTRAELGIPEEAVVFTLVARGIPGKGWVEAVRAFRALQERHPDRPMALLAAGTGPEADRARALAGDDPAIRFLGFVTRVSGLYRLSDVAFAPTRYPGESFPLCLVQAMQAGKPAVATDIGEIRAMIRPDESHLAGLTVPNLAEDDAFVAALVEAMDAVLDPGLRARLAASSAELGRGYSIDALADRYLDLYASAVSGRDRQPAADETA